MFGRRISSRAGGGFTLVEILIVVVILGVLAAIVIPGSVSAMDETSRGAFIADLKIFGDAAALYYARTGDFLEDSESGVLPTGFDEYVDEVSWTRGTPIGGVWDAELNESGITSAIGVHFNGVGKTRDDAYMLLVDQTFDDADLADGMFRKIAAERYYYIIEE